MPCTAIKTLIVLRAPLSVLIGYPAASGPTDLAGHQGTTNRDQRAKDQRGAPAPDHGTNHGRHTPHDTRGADPTQGPAKDKGPKGQGGTNAPAAAQNKIKAPVIRTKAVFDKGGEGHQKQCSENCLNTSGVNNSPYIHVYI